MGLPESISESLQPIKPRIGVKLTALTDPLLQDIIGIYDQVVGGHASELFREQPPENKSQQILEELQQGNSAEFRFGSRLTRHSKLKIQRIGYADDDLAPIVEFSFAPNTEQETADGRQLCDTFRSAVDIYLQEHELATKLL